MTQTATRSGLPKMVSQAHPHDPNGHLEDLRTDPVGLLRRVRAECGDLGRFLQGDRDHPEERHREHHRAGSQQEVGQQSP